MPVFSFCSASVLPVGPDSLRCGERSCAEAVADALIDAELTGVFTHGAEPSGWAYAAHGSGMMSQKQHPHRAGNRPPRWWMRQLPGLARRRLKFTMERCIAVAKKRRALLCRPCTLQPLRHRRHYTRMAAEAGYDRICLHQSQRASDPPSGSAEPYMGHKSHLRGGPTRPARS